MTSSSTPPKGSISNIHIPPLTDQLTTPAILSPSTPRRTLTHSASLASFESVSPITPHTTSSSPTGKQQMEEEEREENAKEMSIVLGALMKCEAQELEAKLHLLSQLQRLLHQGSTLPGSSARDGVKDEFRRSGGFLSLVQLLSALEVSLSTAATSDQALHERLRSEILKLTLSILHAALDGNTANANYFERSVGWDSLLASLRLSGLASSSPRHFFGALLGLAVGDVSGWMAWIERTCLALETERTHREEKEEQDWLLARVSEAWTSAAIELPKAIVVVIALLHDLGQSQTQLRLVVAAIVQRLASASKRNQVALAQADIASQLFVLVEATSPTASRGTPTNPEICLARAAQHVLELGLDNSTLRNILRRLLQSDASALHGPLMDLLLNVASPSRDPQHLTFDLSHAGHASVAFSSLRRPFPPSPASRGFSFFALLRIERIEPSAQVELLHIFDASRSCSVQLTLEPGTGLVNYATSAEARTRFAGKGIPTGRWTHLCLTHARPKGGAKTSLAQLFIDGILVDERMAPWPNNPASSQAPVRAVLGTPPERPVAVPRTPSMTTTGASPRKRNSRLIWSLGPAYLLDAIVAPDLPLVLQQLAQRYNGNLQDSLGRFLTYKASTLINLRLNSLSRPASGATASAAERDLSKHPLVTAIAGSARELFNEERLYFVLTVSNTWPLARQSATLDAAQRPGPVVLLNQAVPLTRGAIAQPFGYAKLYGKPTCVETRPLDEAVWHVGGTSVLLALVEKADDKMALERTMKLFFDLVENSWRLSEDAEKSRAYEVLSLLLHVQRKKGLVGTQVLAMFLRATGVDDLDGDEAALVNPFLYRLFLLDFELWSSDAQTQQMHLTHFGTLLKKSLHRRFNIKRVARMQIVKKLLYALRAGCFATETIPLAIEAVRIVLTASFSDAATRAVTSYLASQLCQSTQSTTAEPASTPRSPNRPAPPKRSETLTHGVSLASLLDRHQTVTDEGLSSVPLQIFGMLADLVLERPSYLSKLATTINLKWLLLFLAPQAERRAASLALAILAQFLDTQPRYTERLSSAGGFKVLEALLPRFWDSPTVLPWCFSILFGMPYTPGSKIIDSLAPQKAKAIRCAPVMRALVAALKEGIRATAAKDGGALMRRSSSRGGRPSDFLAAPTNRSTTGRHARKRSQSMNLDSKELAESFKLNSELNLLSDAVTLLELHSAASVEFRNLLFSHIVLRGLVHAVVPHVRAVSNPDVDRDSTGASPIEVLCDRILSLLCQLAFEAMCESGSTAIVSALISAVPPSDLATAASYRLDIYSKLCGVITHAIEARPSLAEDLHSCAALASFAEDASNETLHDSALETSYHLIISLLSRMQSPGSAHVGTPRHSARSTLITSLNRVLLFRLANSTPDDAKATLDLFIENQAVIFTDVNQDDSFFMCSLHMVLTLLTSQDEAVRSSSFNLLRLIALSRPALVQPALKSDVTLTSLLGAEILEAPTLISGLSASEEANAEAVPYRTEWAGFLKSIVTLKQAAHLERVAHLHSILERTGARDQAAASTEKRMVAWQASLKEAEDVRFAKFALDARELGVFAASEWKGLYGGLTRERGLLGLEEDSTRLFKLDLQAQRGGVRIKLQPLPRAEEAGNVPYIENVDEGEAKLAAATPTVAVHGDAWGSGDALVDEPGEEGARVPPTASTERLAPAPALAPEPEPRDVAEEPLELQDDKFRRVLRSLERGDRVEDVFNTSRVVGIESRAALCILGKDCLYLIDDLYQRPTTGELCAVWEAPAEERDALVMATMASNASQLSKLIAQLEGEAQTRKWTWGELSSCRKRSFLHRRTAVEIAFQDGQSYLLVLDKTDTAERLFNELGLRNSAAVSTPEQLRNDIREGSVKGARPTGGSLSSRLAGAVLGRAQQPGALTQAWQERRISNFDYLMQLNTLAGRTYNDLTQYPVFPWILADYTSDVLDLSNPATFRRLDLPMGAQTPARRAEFEDRYRQLVEFDEGQPFHYGTHYSTAATVCGYLIRVRPFEKLLMALQGDTFDLADRTFSSIAKAWHSASEGSSGDVRELTPEWYYLPSMFQNSNNFDFGRTQAGEVIGDVELPPWARGDPKLFIQRQKEALESDYVSAHLASWIDLVFGSAQRGQAAVERTNVFNFLSYQDGVDLDSIESSMERQAAAQTIFHFGCTPTQLFSNPHPARHPRQDIPRLPAGQQLGVSESPWLLCQSIVPIRTLKGSVHFIYAERPERAFASPKDYLIMPKLELSLSSGHLDGSMRLFSSRDPSRPAGITEQMTSGRILCCAQAGPSLVVVGSSDGLVGVWKVDVKKAELTAIHAMRAHSGPILSLSASSTWGVALSGSEDTTAVVWDLNRREYVRTLRGHDFPVQLTAIDERSGLLATAAGPEIRIWSINGELIARASTNASANEPVASLAFYERDWHEGKLALLLTGHRGKVIAWACTPPPPAAAAPSLASGHKRSLSTSSREPTEARLWKLEPHHVFEHHDRIGPSTMPLITAIHTNPTMLFTGDELGRLYVWALPGEAVPVPDSFSSTCMGCEKRFGVLEAKRTCVGCGGLFCSSCTQTSTFGNSRFCEHCFGILSLLPQQ